jgi:hypothetical protein
MLVETAEAPDLHIDSRAEEAQEVQVPTVLVLYL